MSSRLPLLSALGALALTCTASTARAQNKSGEFSVQRFEPAPGWNNYLSVEGARMETKWGFSAGLLFDYAKDPFVIVSCKSRTDCSSPNALNTTNVGVVRDLFTWNIMGAVSPHRRVQIGLRLPVALVNGDGLDTGTGAALSGGLRGAGVGDPMVEVKTRFVGEARSKFVLGGALDASAPLGHSVSDGKYIGNSGPVTGGLRAILDLKLGAVSIGANLRGVYHQAASVGSTTLGPVEFRYGVGLGYTVSPSLRLVAEGFGATNFTMTNGSNSLEAAGALQLRPGGGRVALTLGGGAGVLAGVGVPSARGIAGLSFVNEAGDQDSDGVPDTSDQCPTIAEDMDGFEDSDGCPEADNDADGIPDEKDKCPNAPETMNGVADDDGCPDTLADKDDDGIADAEDKCPTLGGKTTIRAKGQYYGCPDTDQDGVPDNVDKCPDKPEDTDGYADEDGCPDPDNDGDGVLDESDECQTEPEIINGVKDTDGCPDDAIDRDHDGIADSLDKCPVAPETFNGVDDTDGCPDQPASPIIVTESEIKLSQPVNFAAGTDKLDGSSSKVLDAAAGAIRAHGEFFTVQIGVSTDEGGGGEKSTALSQARANAVSAYLVQKGVPVQRLAPKGLGAAGKKKSAVEFKIVSAYKRKG
jgi:outer membrane protein OmpA-like peptidoglycan-associated protein